MKQVRSSRSSVKYQLGSSVPELYISINHSLLEDPGSLNHLRPHLSLNNKAQFDKKNLGNKVCL